MLQCNEGVQQGYEARLRVRAGDAGPGLIPALVRAVQHPGAQRGSVH